MTAALFIQRAWRERPGVPEDGVGSSKGATHHRQFTIFEPAPSALPLESAAALGKAFWSADPHALNQTRAQDPYFTDSGEDSDNEDDARGEPRPSRSGWASPPREGKNAREYDSIEAQEHSAPAEASNVLPKPWGAWSTRIIKTILTAALAVTGVPEKRGANDALAIGFEASIAWRESAHTQIRVEHHHGQCRN